MEVEDDGKAVNEELMNNLIKKEHRTLAAIQQTIVFSLCNYPANVLIPLIIGLFTDNLMHDFRFSKLQ